MTTYLSPVVERFRAARERGELPRLPLPKRTVLPNTDAMGNTPTERVCTPSCEASEVSHAHADWAPPPEAGPDEESALQEDWTVFLGLDPGLLCMGRDPEEMRVTLFPALVESGRLDLLDRLQHFPGLRRRRQWTVDVSRLPQLTLPLLDALLRMGKEAHGRGGRLLIAGLCPQAVAHPFLGLFLDRCGDLGVIVVSAASAAEPNPGSPFNDEADIPAVRRSALGALRVSSDE